jgi:NADH:ubiquinone oxidoreductase subunit F (NADH-binding)
MTETKKIEACWNSDKGLHIIDNNTASMWKHGTCGLCVRCTGAFRPQECYDAFVEGHVIDENLKHTLVRFGYEVEGMWLCQSCNSVFNSNVDRVEHFRAQHYFK